MKNKITTITLIIFATFNGFAQKIFENPQYQFAMNEPTNWIQATNSELIKNLEKMEINE